MTKVMTKILQPKSASGSKGFAGDNTVAQGVPDCQSNFGEAPFMSLLPTLCECGKQSISHMLQCIQCPSTRTEEDFILARENAVVLAQYWVNVVSF